MPHRRNHTSARSNWKVGSFPGPIPVRPRGPVLVPPASSDPPFFTPRQRQIIVLIASGHSTKQVAERLGIRPKTVECHRTRIHAILDDGDIACLTRLAIARGWIRP